MNNRDDSRGGPGGTRSLEELRKLSLLNRTPTAPRPEGSPSVTLPAVEAPSLEGVSVVEAGPVAPVTPRDIAERYEALRREHTPRHERAADEPVALEDEVLLDVVGFFNDRVLPFSAWEDWWARVAPDPLFPGFYESLVGVPVGKILRVDLRMSDDYAVPAMRGQLARFIAQVKAARVLTPTGREERELPARVGVSSHEELLRTLGERLLRERQDEVARRTQERVMDALVDSTPVRVPPALVDEEVRRLWEGSERPILERKGISPERRQQALEGWLSDPYTRGGVEYRIKLDMVLSAIARREGLTPDRALMQKLLEELQTLSGVSREALGQTVKADPALSARLYGMALHLTTVQHVMKHVRVKPAA